MMGLTVAVIDYEAGNLRSMTRALQISGARPVVLKTPAAGGRFDAIVLPGVGAFGAAMLRLREAGMPAWIADQVAAGTPLIGVCLGMQLLYAGSEEGGDVRGLSFLRGNVRRLPEGLKVPHVGWNSLEMVRPSPITAGIGAGAHVYFVHSYVVDPQDAADVVATTSYGMKFPAIVQRGPVMGLQFHPEKSADVGLRLLRNVLAAAAASRAGRPT